MTILNPSENEIKLACHDAIINCVARMTDVEGRDNDNFYTLYCDGVEMLWTDYVTYTLKNPVFVSGIGYITDIFLFGDGTLEFLRAYDDEPMCWDELSASGLSEVSKYVTKEFSDYLLKNIN